MYIVDGLLPTHGLELQQLDAVMLFAWDFLEIDEEVTIEIDFVDDMEDHQSGDADVDGNIGQISINRDITSSQLIPTIFHEMVHIKQIFSNDLVIGEGKLPSTWKGSYYTDSSYKELPWEQEAFELERHMMEKFERI